MDVDKKLHESEISDVHGIIPDEEYEQRITSGLENIHAFVRELTSEGAWFFQMHLQCDNMFAPEFGIYETVCREYSIITEGYADEEFCSRKAEELVVGLGCAMESFDEWKDYDEDQLCSWFIRFIDNFTNHSDCGGDIFFNRNYRV